MSGGVLCTNPIGASGMLRFAEAAMQVRGTAGEHQVDGARTAVGHAYGGGSQFFAMWVVGPTSPEGRRQRSPSSPVAARGQGEAEARLFAAEGAKVVLADVLDEEGAAVAAAIGDAARFEHLDVTDEDELEGGRGRHRGGLRPGQHPREQRRHPRLQRRSTGTTPTEFRRVLDINLTGAFLGIKSVVPSMKQGGQRLDHQHLVERRDGGPAVPGGLLVEQVGASGACPGRPPSSSAATASASTPCTRAASTRR